MPRPRADGGWAAQRRQAVCACLLAALSYLTAFATVPIVSEGIQALVASGWRACVEDIAMATLAIVIFFVTAPALRIAGTLWSQRTDTKQPRPVYARASRTRCSWVIIMCTSFPQACSTSCFSGFSLYHARNPCTAVGY